MLPGTVQVADPFHLVKLANQRLNDVRRRVQHDTLGHRGRKNDPLYRSRRLLTKADERLDDRGREKLLGLLEAGDPKGEVRMAWHAKEVVREIYAHRPRRRSRVRHPPRRRSPGRLVSARGPPTRTDDHEVAHPDRRVARSARLQRADRSSEQPDQGREAHRVRVHVVPELPDPHPALRRPTQLGPTRHHQPNSPVTSEELVHLAYSWIRRKLETRGLMSATEETLPQMKIYSFPEVG